MASTRHISIGFQASPPIALRVSRQALDELLGKLGGEGWYDLQGEDGNLRLSLQHVLWVRQEKDDQRVGFGLST
jgi:hypothetical protein